jgi:diguanylate cyclase (GGDEF)-like protein/PAS domain S-box-containing protein
MSLAKTIFIFPIVISSILLTILLTLSWIHRVERLARALMRVVVCSLIWSVGYGLVILSNTLDQKIFWDNVKNTGSFAISFFWLALVVMYTGRESQWRKYYPYFAILPLFFIGVMWTDKFHHLFRFQTTLVRPAYSFTVLKNSYTSFFYLLFTPYNTIVFLSCLGLLLEVFYKARGRLKIQAILLICGSLPPLMAELFVMLGKTPVPYLSYTTHTFLISGIMLGWAVFKFDLYQSVLLARDVVVDTLQEGIVVVDRNNRLIDLNASAQMMLGVSAGNAIGLSAEKVLKILDTDSQLLEVNENHCVELNIGQLYLEVSVVPVRCGSKSISARVITLHDITERVLLLEQLKHLAHYDMMTGVLNRSALFNHAEKLIEDSRLSNGCCSLIMLDIDQFKRINDLYGHLTGDRALKLAVDICCSALRAKDLIGRYGGEEFIVVLPETNLDEAQKIANRLRVSIEQTPLVTERGFDRITASFGVVCSGMFGCAAELEKMISVADQALYLAKGKGANQVVAIENPTHLIQERHESCAA